jgi:DNA-binding transcriptional regulator LsrR (DeoR family)
VFLEQRGVADILELGVEATLRFVGIGTLGQDASILSAGLVENNEFDEARRLGAVGELLGHMFTARGELIDSSISARALSIGPRYCTAPNGRHSGRPFEGRRDPGRACQRPAVRPDHG